MISLASLSRGSLDTRIKFVFDMCDVNKDGLITKEQLETLLNQIPKEMLQDHRTESEEKDQSVSSRDSENSSQLAARKRRRKEWKLRKKNKDQVAADVALAAANELRLSADQLRLSSSENDGASDAKVGADVEDESDDGRSSISSYSSEGTVNSFEEITAYTNHDIVVKAFEECDIEHDGRLTYEEFKMWVENIPAIMIYIESILPYSGSKDSNPHQDKCETLPLMQRHHSMRRTGSIESLASSNGGNGSRNRSATGLGTSPTFSGRGDFAGRGGGQPLSRQNSEGSTGSSRSRSVTSPAIKRVTETVPNHSTFSAVPEDVSEKRPPYHYINTHSEKESLFAGYGVHTIENAEGNTPLSMNAKLGNSLAVDQGADMNDETGALNLENIGALNEVNTCKHLELALNATSNPEIKLAIRELLDQILSLQNTNIRRENSFTDVYRTAVPMEGKLYKRGAKLLMWNSRYYILSGNCVYYYTKQSDLRPKGVIFLTGCIIEKAESREDELAGYYGFELIQMETSQSKEELANKNDRRTLFCKSEKDRDEWVHMLQQAAHVVPITEEYVIGKELGRGRFSTVHECVNKITHVHAAVKIINKSQIKSDEKVLLRTEIAVLKLMDHPHIIKMMNLYESKDNIYIVMEMLKGGELFERIVGKPRFTEIQAARLLRPLLEAVAYIHDLGIVHRDIKPENILCGEDLSDLKIADFGLSKMIMPNETMGQACGTLSYVAPEVLTSQGYGKSADLWSVGVILFLLVCGKLPFDGDVPEDIIKATVQGDLKVNPKVWSKLSDPCKQLMRALLNKKCDDRITARQALKHTFLTINAPVQHKHYHHHHHHHHVSRKGESKKASDTK